MSSADISSFIAGFHADKRSRDTIVAQNIKEAVEAVYGVFPSALLPPVTSLFASQGILQPYSHQSEALQHIIDGKNVVISAGVASGKSLCYQAAIINSLLSNPHSRALLMFPTKALAQDQAQKMQGLLINLAKQNPRLHGISSGIYDGDTPTELRGKLRKQSQILFTNPDMLHLGILPNHSLWSAFFSQLNYVIIDEVHIYRGVFGSHFANVIRRLKRVCKVYGKSPQFIFTSATLANAQELAEALCEEQVQLVDTDGSPHGERHFYICNPPMIEPSLGIRRSSTLEVSSIARRFLDTGLQAILFSETRPSVEMLLLYLKTDKRASELIRSYRSGYLADERRKIERELRNREIAIVISTNALELGIDIGGLDAVFINGYPGTICGTRQQAGRAGRQGNTSLGIMVAGANPLDQYICQHPEYLFGSNPEQALIDPDNSDILRMQLLCAISEMALQEGESFGALKPENFFGHLHSLVEENLVKRSGNRYIGVTGNYPAGEVSIRNAANQFQILYQDDLIGWVDSASVSWMAHPKAIYLHQGETWIVQDLDYENKKVILEPIPANYYTQTLQRTEITLDDLLQIENVPGGRKHFGKVTVTITITGFKKLRFYSQEILEQETLDLPPSVMQTQAWWISLSAETVEKTRAMGLWNNDPNDYGKGWAALAEQIKDRDSRHCRNCGTGGELHVHHIIPFRKFPGAEEANHPDNLVSLCPRCHHLAEQRVYIQSGLAALAYLIGNLAPFFVMCAQKDLGIHSEDKSPLAMGAPVIVIYDKVAGGIGLSRKLYQLHNRLIYAALDRVKSCSCTNGCPACVGPVAENGMGAKEEAIAILQELIE
ncbi:MAG: ATP-dependent helicase [Candidatus Cloacimonetes bacterium HGW-Cloacimonetes-3]|jgi:DEAD/DEAH box helicase domain-containing protein|nr:MAG: ATP-dependent helicase [Candidatus Cloacimonetes bacterium HGW-Cloacimonetes-3]